MNADAQVAKFTMRCHSCSHGVGVTHAPVRIVGLFRASLYGRLPSTTAGEIRKRCSSCGWVNVFHPRKVRRPAVELKQAG